MYIARSYRSKAGGRLEATEMSRAVKTESCTSLPLQPGGMVSHLYFKHSMWLTLKKTGTHFLRSFTWPLTHNLSTVHHTDICGVTRASGPDYTYSSESLIQFVSKNWESVIFLASERLQEFRKEHKLKKSQNCIFKFPLAINAIYKEDKTFFKCPWPSFLNLTKYREGLKLSNNESHRKG